MILFRTVVAFSFTIIIMLCFVPLGLPAFLLGFLGLKKQMSWVIYMIAKVWAISVVKITGCSMTVEGMENVPKSGGVCFVSNHVGIFDIILALAYIGRPFGFIAKKELVFLPFINMWIYILGGLFIDRKNIRNAIKTINNGIKKIQNGASMLIFPEGTRSKGRGVLPFKSGAIKLATSSLAPIIPIAITGSYDVFEIDFRVHPAPVRIVFCPPVITVDMSAEDRKQKLADNIRSIIEDTLHPKQSSHIPDKEMT